MDYIQRQRGNIVLYKEQKADVEIADKYTAYIVAVSFKLSAFYDRYSPHAYIDYSRVCATSQTQEGIHAAERLSETAGTETAQPIHHKDLPGLFQRLHGAPH